MMREKENRRVRLNSIIEEGKGELHHTRPAVFPNFFLKVARIPNGHGSLASKLGRGAEGENAHKEWEDQRICPRPRSANFFFLSGMPWSRSGTE